ncbi:MAG: DUF2061 domain-containing protein [Noviherbaspirillum sp.]
MVTAARTASQALVHVGIAFAITWGVTGSLAFGGLAAVIEALLNVMVLPLHEKAWAAMRRAMTGKAGWGGLLAEKTSQGLLHAGIAFAVMYWASGSLAFGGLVAVLEPVCNILLLPLHDRAWRRLQQKFGIGDHGRFAPV